MKAVYTLAAATPPSTLSWLETLAVVGVIAVAIVLIGILVILGRRWVSGNDPTQSVVRSWLALALVAGMVLYCGVTFAVNDANLRSTVFGGLTASVGAAVAFYFSSKSSDQARQDILNATFGTETVPNLCGSTESEAAVLLGKTSLKMEVSPGSSEAAGAKVASQQPPKDSVVRKGTSVVVTLSPPDAPSPAAPSPAAPSPAAPSPAAPSPAAPSPAAPSPAAPSPAVPPGVTSNRPGA